ncbi:MAG: hypothetical protein RL322_3291, partial [Pseudomonadota bacterium]
MTDDLSPRRRWLLGMMAVVSSPVLSAESSEPVADASEIAASPVLEFGSRRASSTRSQIGRPIALVAGKSTLIHVDSPIERISVGNPAVADVTLISPEELYLLGKTFGSTNL